MRMQSCTTVGHRVLSLRWTVNLIPDLTLAEVEERQVRINEGKLHETFVDFKSAEHLPRRR